MPRKQHDYHYIYKTINLINSKFYIGMHSTSNLEDGYIGSGKRLWYSIGKYGRENFKMEILEFLPDRSSLKEREKEIVNSDLLKEELCMNLMAGGQGGYCGNGGHIKWSSAGGKASFILNKEERVKEFSERAIELHKKGILKAPDWTGKTHKQETRDKIGESVKISQKGEKNSQYGTCWIKHELLGIKKIKKELIQQFIDSGWIKGR